jgi:DNA-binding Lrp family transcriptional regulator
MISPMKKERLLDELDRQILSALRATPLETNKALADKLSVSEATIASRIRALENDRVMKVMAQCDFRAAGYQVLANVEVSVAGRLVEEVSGEISALERVALLSINMGEPAISLLVMATDLNDLQELTMGAIAGIDGVRSVETMVFTEIIKYRSEFVAL